MEIERRHCNDCSLSLRRRKSLDIPCQKNFKLGGETKCDICKKSL